MRGGASIDRTYGGGARVVVNGSIDAFGYGWNLPGFDQLVTNSRGTLRFYGAGAGPTSSTMGEPATR